MIKFTTHAVDGFLTHPGDTEGCGDRLCNIEVCDDSDNNDGFRLRVEVKCRADLGEVLAADCNNYGWHECSARITLDEARELHAAIGTIIAVEERRERGE